MRRGGDGPGDREALLLAARELHPALADPGLVALGQALDELVRVRAPYGRQTMCDDERCPSGEQRGHRCLNELLALGVEVARGLVEDQDLRVGQDRAGNAQALPLPSG